MLGDILKTVPPRAAAHPAAPRRQPQLTVAWQSRQQNLAANLRAVLAGPMPPKTPPQGPYFRDSWVQSSIPKKALLASALWHAVMIFVPFPQWPSTRAWSLEAQPSYAPVDITYYAPMRDLPHVNPQRGQPARPSPPGEPEKPLPQRGAQAFHPRQTIISAPRVPTHPRQTLIAPDAPPEPPKILPPLPNIVQWTSNEQPARPRLQISRDTLAKLRPKRPAMTKLSVPDVPNLDRPAGDLNIAASASSVPQPRMPVTPMSVPAAGPRQIAGDSAAPDVRPNVRGEGGVGRLIAISPNPAAPVSNLPVPSGNLAANVTIAPEGTRPGVPGGSPSGSPAGTGGSGGGPGSPGGNSGGGARAGTGGGGSGSSGPGVSISGGSPNAFVSVAGRAEPEDAPVAPPVPLVTKPESRPAPEDADRTPPAPGFDRIQPGAPPETIFGLKRVYTLHVNMPNLASVTGSWVLSFVEMNQTDELGRPTNSSPTDLTGPVPMRKVDPKYPSAMRNARVEGEVILYAVIRRDGSVDSIQLVHGIETELDHNAMEALSRWRFRPAERQGNPVELEAIVHIPFRSVIPN